jgi:hypothetical protein
MLLASVTALALMPARTPPMRAADGAAQPMELLRAAAAARPAIRMAATVDSAKDEGLFAKVKGLNTMNKMANMKKGQKPKLRGKRLSPAMQELVGNFKKAYPAKDVEVLWAALLKVYGSQPAAEAAALTNPQILNPSYSFCNTMLASAEVLEQMMGREEALEVMTKNPAVLQCGPSLDTLGPDEIKAFANIRALGNKIPESARSIALIALFTVVLFPVAAQNNPALQDSAILNLSKPLVGIFFSILIEGSRIAIVGTILKAKVAGNEREKAAMQRASVAERRRMGKA